MERAEFRNRLSGVIAFPITPFRRDGSLDLVGFRGNLEALLLHPLCAWVIAGGTGELYSLTPAEHLDLVRTAVEVSGGRVPVIAGTGFNQAIGVSLAKAAAAEGASGILAFPPYYPQPEADGLLNYYRALGAATDLAFIIYSRDWANFSPESVERLSSIPTLVAWKDGQGDLRRYQLITERVGDRLHWIGGAGDDLVPGYYSMGIRTYTSSIANVAPRLSLLLHERAAAGDQEELNRLMKAYVLPLYAFRSRRRGYEVSAMKSMMEMIGRAGGPVRPPLVDLGAAELEEIRAMIDRWGAVLTC